MDIFGFLHFSFADIVDIMMVAVLIYLIFRWIKGSAAMNIFLAVILVFVTRVVVAAFNMRLMNAIMGTFIDVGVLALIILFQPEIRHWLIRLGTGYKMTGKGVAFVRNLLGIKETKMAGGTVNELSEACRMMSADKTGALIVLRRNDTLETVTGTGDKIDAIVSRRLIMNLFFKNSPLHDGAVIILGDRIVAARCTLPITERTNIPAKYGMRHKAAIGITEESDADVIVVSEETGQISFVRAGNITRIGNINELKLLIGTEETPDDRQQPQKDIQVQQAGTDN